MKVNFTVPEDGNRYRFCMNCKSTSIKDVIIDGKTMYKCSNCNETNERLYDFDPEIKWWIDPDTKELWHESVGVFILNDKFQILLFERTIYPYGHTIPTGHLASDEDPEESAKREVYEEVGVSLTTLRLIADTKLNESCRKGSDFHKWNLFNSSVTHTSIIVDKSEGKKAGWYDFDSLASMDLTKPTRYFVDNIGKGILQL